MVMTRLPQPAVTADREDITMQAVAIGRYRINPGALSVAGLALMVALVGGTVGIMSIGNPEHVTTPVAPDTTTLVLDRNGADLFAPSGLRAVDTMGLNLDRDGADIAAPAPGPAAVDTTGLSLDRDGADTFQGQPAAAPDVTTSRLDRDGADIP
jgi:hypothetical protein